MPDIPMLPDHLRSAPGVMMTPPPPEIMPQVTGMITRAVAQLGANERGKLVWIAQKNGGQVSVNAAIVHKVNDNVVISAWLGKTWHRPIEVGIAGSVSW